MDSWVQAAMQAEDYRSALTAARAMRVVVQGEQQHWAVFKEFQCLERLGMLSELFELAATADPGKYAGRLYSRAAELARELGERMFFDRFAARTAEATEDFEYLKQAWSLFPGPELAMQRVLMGIALNEPEEAFAGHLGLLDLVEEHQNRNLAAEAWLVQADLRKLCFTADYMHELVARWERLNGLLGPAERQAWEHGRKAYQAGAAGEQVLLEGLMMHGISLDSVDVAGRSAAFGAAMTGALGMLEWLLAHGAALDLPNYQLMTPLMAAVMENKTHVVEFLLPKHARIDRRGPGGNTALHFAAHLNRYDICEHLLKRGANPALANANGETPRALAEPHENLRPLFKPPQGGLLSGLLKRR